MFKKSERLGRADFTHYFKCGKRQHTDVLTLVHQTHNELHVSVVVGKKVAKKAHDRNALRRRVYGQLYARLKGKASGVFIVVVKPEFARLTRMQQLESVQKMLTRITMSPTS